MGGVAETSARAPQSSVSLGFSNGPNLATRIAMVNDVGKSRLAHADLTDKILASFFETYAELGHGFSEQLLCRALAIVLRQAGLNVLEEASVEANFRGQSIGRFRVDLIVNRTILIEVKGTAEIEPHAKSQLLNYLKVAGGGVGLLLNFGHRPQFKRMVMGDPANSLPLLP